MAQLTFDVYGKDANGDVSLVETIELDTEIESAVDARRVINRVIDLHKDTKHVVSPGNNESALAIFNGKSRGRKKETSPELVKFIHEQYVIHEQPINRIPFLILREFSDLDVDSIPKESVIKAILNQERDTDVPGFESLREDALAKKETRVRKKYTDDDRAEWVRMHVEEGMSGADIGRRVGVNSATINAHLNAQGVQQNQRGGRPKAVEVAEEITE